MITENIVATPVWHLKWQVDMLYIVAELTAAESKKDESDNADYWNDQINDVYCDIGEILKKIKKAENVKEEEVSCS